MTAFEKSGYNDPGVGGCLTFLTAVVLGFYLIPGFVFGWVLRQDDVASACPTSGVSTVVTHWTWGGPDFTVTCINGKRVHIPTWASW